MANIKKNIYPLVIFLLITILSLITFIGLPKYSPCNKGCKSGFTSGCTSCNKGCNKGYEFSHVNAVAEILPASNIAGVSTRNSPAVVVDPYGPPLRNDGVFFPRDSGDIRGGVPVVACKCGSCSTCLGGVPINIETRGMPAEFTQVGILTRGSDNVLTLMGRKLVNGSDKWQYYTYTNSGIMATKVSVYAKGRDAMSEYGIDRLYDGDNVFVDGYEETYRAKMYENSKFRYLPFL